MQHELDDFTPQARSTLEDVFRRRELRFLKPEEFKISEWSNILRSRAIYRYVNDRIAKGILPDHVKDLIWWRFIQYNPSCFNTDAVYIQLLCDYSQLVPEYNIIVYEFCLVGHVYNERNGRTNQVQSSVVGNGVSDRGRVSPI